VNPSDTAKPASNPALETTNPLLQSKSYALLDPNAKTPYLEFYRVTYQSKGAVLDRKTKELIAIGAALALNCQGCLDGHIKKALKDGATREEISETIAVTLGVAAAAIVDRSDLAGARMNIAFDNLPSAFEGGRKT
jgi:AhpD family alkylhydroperoxidase